MSTTLVVPAFFTVAGQLSYSPIRVLIGFSTFDCIFRENILRDKGFNSEK
jgi:hypothetical protein